MFISVAVRVDGKADTFELDHMRSGGKLTRNP